MHWQTIKCIYFHLFVTVFAFLLKYRLRSACFSQEGEAEFAEPAGLVISFPIVVENPSLDDRLAGNASP